MPYTWTLPITMNRLFFGNYTYGRNDASPYKETHTNLSPCIDTFTKSTIRLLMWNASGIFVSGYGFCIIVGC